MISVVVPAHNEGTLIETALRHLVAGARPGEIEVLVVCNGCEDDTEARARSVGEPVRVFTTRVASKARALNIGDDEASGFPRFYVDADVLIDMPAIRMVAAVLESGAALAAAPCAFVDARDASWAVRAYYRVWTTLPYFDASMIGSGVYALSSEGRRRFDRFPDLIADDEFVRRLFLPSERQRVSGCRFAIRPPSRLRGVIRDKTRSRLGLYQLDRRFPAAHPARTRLGPAAIAVLKRPGTWPGLPLYAVVASITRMRARRRAAAGNFDGWERDWSSRPLRAQFPKEP
jgi:glycosyltransferase involved in cell wall biosynthesis